ncbi:alpha/beta fold hydrolase [Streptomyces sp. 4F14]|uniref:alpha/beta fold hydrolase n=1 Tax=Streptomyces sp. 4F14 TaxID=3394380 RepID=UPI003A897CE0
MIRRLAYAAAGALAPGPAGRRATDAFSTTRAFGIHPDDLPPLGARTFPVPGAPRVREGYLWGPDDAPTALLVHGWGADSSSMHSLIGPLRALGYRVAAFDAPGHGVSAGTQATMTEYVDALGAVLDTLGPVRAAVAHSLGSIVTAAALAGRPHQRIDSLTLVAPTRTLGGVLDRWATGRLPTRTADLIRAELHRRNGVPVTHWDLLPHGRRLTAPVLVVADPHDPVVPFAEAETIAAGLPRARLRSVPGSGHLGILMAAETKETTAAFVAEHAEENVL